MGPVKESALSVVAFQSGSEVWVPIIETLPGIAGDGTRKKVTQWQPGVVQARHQNRGDEAVDDLVKSDFLHEPGILHTLGARYALDSIYTFSGPVLIAVNPHKKLRGLYGARMMSQYRGAALGDLAPHVYAIAEQAYASMLSDEAPQAILISGESGAGKTESAKLVMQYLAHRAAGFAGTGTVGGGEVSSASASASVSGSSGNPLLGGMAASAAAPIEEQVLESNPLLEAFGNAKTSRNDNSSRFGKYVEIEFDPLGRVCGASISTYLLERSRVTSVRSPERSYHIFYQLCAGASPRRRQALGLSAGARSFRYLSSSDAFELDEVDDAKEYAASVAAMRVVGLGEREIDEVLEVVAAILHLGNVEFAGDADEPARLADVAAERALRAAAALLKVSPDAALRALTVRTLEAGPGERIDKPLNALAAAESRDALARLLYTRLFDWLVAAINRKIGAVGSKAGTAHGASAGAHGTAHGAGLANGVVGGSKRATPPDALADGLADAGAAAGAGAALVSSPPPPPASRTVAILDIYGFESFETNSFEQLCINLANERLQQQFNAHVFKGEQAEYEREGISWSYVEFVDNQPVLDLLEGAGPRLPGVFPLIDEACRLPRATPEDLAHALRTRLAARPAFAAPRRRQDAFAVEHYAGAVVYAVAELMEKNRDFVVAEHAGLLASSAGALVGELFEEERAAEALAAAGGGGAGGGGRGAARSGFRLSSVGARFRTQLGGLMRSLDAAAPLYIRCVKPNARGVPGAFAPSYVVEQLRAGGVLEAVRIASAGFPTRKPLQQFDRRYAMLLSPRELRSAGLEPDDRGFVDWSLASPDALRAAGRLLLQKERLAEAQIGKTRAFLRAGQLAALEGARARAVEGAAVAIQSAWRAALARRRLAAARAAAATIQAAWRGRLVRRDLERRRRERAALRVQAAWRGARARAALRAARRERAATVIQARWRGARARRRFARETELGRRRQAREDLARRRAAAATVIQAHIRRRLAARRVEALRREARERLELAAAKEEAEAAAAAARLELEASRARAEGLEARAAELERRLAEDAARAAAAAAEATERARERGDELSAAQARAAEAEKSRGDAEQELSRSRAELAAALAAVAAAEAAAEAAKAAEAHRAAELAERASEIQTVSEERDRAVALSDARAARVEELEARVAELEEAAAAAADRHALALDDAAKEAESKHGGARAAAERGRDEADAKADQALRAEAETRQALAAERERLERLEARLEAVTVRADGLEADLRAAGARERELAAAAERARAEAASARDRERRAKAEAAAAAAAAAAGGAGAVAGMVAGAVGAGAAAAGGVGAASFAAAPSAAAPSAAAPSAAAAQPRAHHTMSVSPAPPSARSSEGSFAQLASTASERSASPSAASAAASREASVARLVRDTTSAALPLVTADLGPGGQLPIPLAGWIAGESLVAWSVSWPPLEVTQAAAAFRAGALAAAEAGGLPASARAMAASLAAGALLKFRSIGRKDGSRALQAGDQLIFFAELHLRLGEAVQAAVPVDVAVLLSEDAKRSARGGGVDAGSPKAERALLESGAEEAREAGLPASPRAPLGAASAFAPPPPLALPGAGVAGRGPGTGTASAYASAFSSPSPSPASPLGSSFRSGAHRVGGHRAGHLQAAWRRVAGGITNVVETLRGEGVPDPAIRATALACLRYVDGELLNALLLRRDCCSVSAAKVLVDGLGELRSWVGYMGTQLVGTYADAERALERVGQAALYLTTVKDDVARKAAKNMDVLKDLQRQCPALSLAQIYRLTEYQHDDWISALGSRSSQSVALLERLHAIIKEQEAAIEGGDDVSEDEDEDEDLLVDPLGGFVLPRKSLAEAARRFITAPNSDEGGDVAVPSGIAILDALTHACKHAGVPRDLLEDPNFAFLR